MALRVPYRGVPNRPLASKAATAFTLIELLVVLAIIALLTAILLPVFASAREDARQSACLNNLKQIGFAVRLYQQDFDGCYVPKYPCATFDDATHDDGSPTYPDHCLSPVRNVDDTLTPSVPEWLPPSDALVGTNYLLRPYIASNDVRLCPSRRTTTRDLSATPDAPVLPDDISRYVINGWDSYYGRTVGKPGTSPQGQPDADVPEPAATLLVWEHNYSSGECQVGQGFDSDPIRVDDAPKHWFTGHHGGTNALWCDGHVRWLLPSQMQRRLFTIQQD